MQRRRAIRNLAILSGSAFLATAGILNACKASDKKRTELSEKDIPLLDAIGETIIPETATSPGAKAAGIGAYMVKMVNDCYNTKDRNIFIDGLDSFEVSCQKQFSENFTALNPIQKKQFLIQLDAEEKQLARNKKAGKESSIPYFHFLKQLSIHGYITSEAGATSALRYDPIPGKYEGCVAYKKGDRPWATN